MKVKLTIDVSDAELEALHGVYYGRAGTATANDVRRCVRGAAAETLRDAVSAWAEKLKNRQHYEERDQRSAKAKAEREAND